MLTDRKIRAEKPGAKRTMLYDQRGRYLLVNPNGSKLWRFKCHIGPRGQRREKLLALGAYPEVTLAEARRRQAEAREIIRQGGDPLAEKLARRAKASLRPVESVEALAREWQRQQLARCRPATPPPSATGCSAWSSPNWASCTSTTSPRP